MYYVVRGHYIISRVWTNQSGKVARPARGQLNSILSGRNSPLCYTLTYYSLYRYTKTDRGKTHTMDSDITQLLCHTSRVLDRVQMLLVNRSRV